MRPAVILCWGLGVDSTAILVRWLLEPATRPAALDGDLSRLAVLTAMTGDEHTETGFLVKQHVLPLLREHGVRYIQVCRRTRLISEGYAVLDDSTAPTTLHLDGIYRLSDELQSAGTVPQRGGSRLCSVHAKGDVLDAAIRDLTAGHPFEHVIGFAADELERVERDLCYGTVARTSRYPLVEWGWSRREAEAYLADRFDVAWPKSCCTYCPFAWSSIAKRVGVAARLEAEPDDDRATLPLWVESIALGLNPRQPLVDGGALAVLAEHAPSVVDRYRRRLDATAAWALYRVRRAWASDRVVYRAIDVSARGGRDELESQLGDFVRDDYTIAQRVSRPRPESGAGREERFAVLPAVIEEKKHPLHDLWWWRLRALQKVGKGVGDVDFVMACAAEVRAQWGWIVPSRNRMAGMYGQRYMRSEINAASRLLRNSPHDVRDGAHHWWAPTKQLGLDFEG